MRTSASVILCSVLLACPAAHAGKGQMSREPRPGERIEKTILGDEKIKQLLVGRWVHEHEIPDTYTIKQIYTFEKDGSYAWDWSDHLVFEKRTRKGKAKGKWTLRDGILTLTPTDSKADKRSLYGRFTAYTIMKVSASTLEWQINWGHSDASASVIRSLTITTYKRVK